MQLTRIACAIAAASLSFGVAFAQEPPNDGRNAEAARSREQIQRAAQSRNNHRDERRDVRQDVHRDVRQDVRRDDRHDDRRNDSHYDGRYDRHEGAGPDHRFYRGGRLPSEYRNRQYVIEDWRGHHLSAPPRGYYWVQTGSDYVLAAIATGVIASIILNSH